MKKKGAGYWILIIFAVFGALCILLFGGVIRAAWNSMGTMEKAKQNKLDLDRAVSKIEERQKEKTE